MKLFGYELILRKAEPPEETLFNVRRIDLKPTDKVIITANGTISRATEERIHAYWKQFAPEVDAMVIGNDLTIDVLGMPQDLH